jgi:protein-S-isoprenylcysteine O-methyltransferase Ste14
MTNPPTETPTPPSTVPWPPILIVATVAGGVALGYLLPLSWPGENDLAARIAGRSLGVAGILLLIWAVVTLRRHGTTVLPDKPATVLVTDGPFRFRRNPIYVADILILLGLAELTQNIWLVILTLPFALLITWLAIIPEERHLEARFGDAYRTYKANTRRWI